jgi:hypothetical protein
MRQAARARVTKLAAAAALAGLAAGCGGDPGDRASSTLGNLLAFNSPNAPGPAPSAPDPRAPRLQTCPEVEVLDGGAALRVGGPAGSSVRHQFSMTDVVRECQLAGGQLSIKVGVEGQVLIGPAGGAGAFSAPVRVAIRKESDQSIASSRVYRVAATVPPGGAQAPFRLVTEPLSVPFVSEMAADDYSVLVQFGGAGSEQRERRRRRR